MVKKWLMSSALMVTAAAFWLPVQAAEKLSEVAPAADVNAEIEAKIKDLEETLSSEDSFGKSKRKALPQAAGVLALLANAAAVTDEDSPLKKSAPDIREAALEIAKAGSLADAKKGLEAAKAAAGGKAGGAKAEHGWDHLLSLDSVMSEISVRNGKLRRTLRKLPDDADAASRDATVLALLALATEADTHEVKDKSDLPKWKDYSKEMQTQMTALAAAIKAKDLDKAKEAFSTGAKACNGCHTDIRDK